MYLVCHGGHCCGIKHIYELGRKPSNMRFSAAGPQYATDPFHYANGAGDIEPGKVFYPDPVPYEPAWRRLDRYIAYCDKRRPAGIIEIVLVSRRPGYIRPSYVKYFKSQYHSWKKTLLKRGFKEVNECRNGNSDNVLHVFHRNCGEVPPLKEKKSASKKACIAGEEIQSFSTPIVDPFD